MRQDKTLRVQLMLSGVLLLVMLSLCLYLQNYRNDMHQSIQRLQTQLNEAQKLSLDRSDEQKTKIDFLLALDEKPKLQNYEPARWLSKLKERTNVAGKASLRARVLVDQSQVLSQHESLKIVSVPLEFEMEQADLSSAVRAIESMGESLESYVSVEDCRVSRARQLSTRQGFWFRCRFLKYAMQVDSS